MTSVCLRRQKDTLNPTHPSITKKFCFWLLCIRAVNFILAKYAKRVALKSLKINTHHDLFSVKKNTLNLHKIGILIPRRTFYWRIEKRSNQRSGENSRLEMFCFAGKDQSGFVSKPARRICYSNSPSTPFAVEKLLLFLQVSPTYWWIVYKPLTLTGKMESKQHGVYVARSWKVEKEILRLCLQQQLGTRISSKRLGDTVFFFS